MCIKFNSELSLTSYKILQQEGHMAVTYDV